MRSLGTIPVGPMFFVLEIEISGIVGTGDHAVPATDAPVMIDDDGTVAAGIEAVGAHLDETRSGDAQSLWGVGAEQRAEVRRLVAWFDGKFHHEVTSPLLMEKVVLRKAYLKLHCKFMILFFLQKRPRIL